MSESNSANGKRARRYAGNFFIIDRRTWQAVCDANDMNAAAAWLLLSQGTGGNNRTTAWSVESIKQYLGIGYPRAKAAIDGLLARKFIRYGVEHTPEKPRYNLPEFAELRRLPSKARKSYDVSEDKNLIWLPNALLTGTSEGECSPIRRLRAAGDLWALRLLVDLYHAQNLRDDGGISREYIWEGYEFKQLGEQGPYTIIGFRSDAKHAFFAGPLLVHKSRPRNEQGSHPVWESVDLLERLGLLAFIPHLMENNTNQAEVVHPFGIGKPGELDLETEIGTEAQRAAAAMCASWGCAKAEASGFDLMCPVRNTLPNARLVGIGRLLYRPHTKRTSAWVGRLHEIGPEYVDGFRRLAEKAAASNLEYAQNS